MKGGGVQFWLVVTCVLLAGNIVIHTADFLIHRGGPEIEQVSVTISGLNTAVTDYIIDRLGFCGYLKQGGNRLAILQNQVTSIGETVTVQVVDVDYRLLVADLNPKVVRLEFIDHD